MAIGSFSRGNAEEVVWFDGFRDIASSECKVKDVTEVRLDPVFENAPFLRLRAGDKLVKARKVPEGKEVMGPEGDLDYFLCSGGKYYRLDASEKDGRLLLSAAFNNAVFCLIFDWDFSRDHVVALRKFLAEYATSLTKKQCDAAIATVREEFPEAVMPGEAAGWWLREPREITIPGQSAMEFQGFAFDESDNRLYRYTLRIGPAVFYVVREDMLAGPGHVDRREFEKPPEGDPDTVTINGPGPWSVDPKTAARKKAEYEKMMRFRQLVTDALAKAAGPGT